MPALDAQRAGRAEYARSALELAEDLGEPTVLAGALALVAFLETLGGEGVALATIERALVLEHSPPWSQVLGRPDWIHGLLVGWSGALASARDTFSVLHREAVDRGDEHSLPFVLSPARALRVPHGRLEVRTRTCA